MCYCFVDQENGVFESDASGHVIVTNAHVSLPGKRRLPLSRTNLRAMSRQGFRFIVYECNLFNIIGLAANMPSNLHAR